MQAYVPSTTDEGETLDGEEGVYDPDVAPYDEQFEQYAENNTGWFELHNVSEVDIENEVPLESTAITALTFDPFYEVLWAGFDSVTSQLYTAFTLHVVCTFLL